MKEERDYEIHHIKVLDGIRALAIIIIVWYHFWQQSWLAINIGSFSLDFIPRFGFLLVDMLVLLSGFCLFLPYARSMVYKEKIPDTKKFYINRVARIVPSYLLSMLVSIIFIIILSKNISIGFFIKDTLTHLTFTHNLYLDTIISTNYLGVLWTVGVEVQLYLIFPFLAKKFIKNPIITYIIMVSISIISTIIFKTNINDSNMSLYVNHTLTFFQVFANGMLGAWLYMKYTKNKKRTIKKDLLCTLISVISLIGYKYVCSLIGSYTGGLQLFQINYRFVLSLFFLVFIISTMMSFKYYRIIFENKVMKFIALISFNLYIYHQFIAVILKENHIPYWEGNVLPNMVGNRDWQIKYFLLCIIVSLVVASITTFAFERPIAKRIKKQSE